MLCPMRIWWMQQFLKYARIFSILHCKLSMRQRQPNSMRTKNYKLILACVCIHLKVVSRRGNRSRNGQSWVLLSIYVQCPWVSYHKITPDPKQIHGFITFESDEVDLPMTLNHLSTFWQLKKFTVTIRWCKSIGLVDSLSMNPYLSKRMRE